MGAAQNQDIPNCKVGGDHGAFQPNVNGPTCAMAASLNPGQTFIANIGGQANFTGQLSDMLSCVLLPPACRAVPSRIRSPRCCARSAPTARPRPRKTGDFLRDDAYLYVDLSRQRGRLLGAPQLDALPEFLFAVGSGSAGTAHDVSVHGVRAAVRRRAAAARASAADLTGTCVSAEDGRSCGVADAVNALKLTKKDPSHVLVDVIAGPTAPFQIKLGPPALADSSQWPYVAPSRTQSDGTSGLPPSASTPSRGRSPTKASSDTDCADWFDVQMAIAANQVATLLSYLCLPSSFDASRCTVVGHSTDASGKTIDHAAAPVQTTRGHAVVLERRTWDGRGVPVCEGDLVQLASGAVSPPSITATCSR